MPQWTLLGLLQGKQTAPWPLAKGTDGQEDFLGMPRYRPELCDNECKACADICPTKAITIRASSGASNRLDIDYGRCIVCQLCTEVCPTGAMTTSSDWAFGARSREDLIWKSGSTKNPATGGEMRRAFRRSLHIRHVDAGSCNGCESELQALNNPFYNLHRLGIFFTASPRFADLLLVTGPVTHAMLGPLRATYEAMAEPRWVLAVGTCAVSGGIAEGGYASGHGLSGVIPVDLYLPGCPPNPAAIIEALLMFLDRVPQRVNGGRLVE
ncbi:MAG TPA: NADH-quinone oxidoreductase subunit NuoB [Xanthobacteraceae bacterium]|nr:NADH-quinone oxidoreductase subunit NuoB [Xanthobacteraceae bacterium]